MAINCVWCGSIAETNENTVYWELPDGTRAIEITGTPIIFCSNCRMTYTTEETVKEIEDQLFLVDTKKISKSIRYAHLMALPRLLKRNYFDFS